MQFYLPNDCKIDALSQGIFPDSLNFANITPVHKKEEATDKQNYRPVSVLPLFSKVFEKVIYDQLSQFPPIKFPSGEFSQSIPWVRN